MDQTIIVITWYKLFIKLSTCFQRPVTDVPRILAPISTGRGYPYDCGDAPSLNSNQLSSFNDELISAYIGEMSSAPTTGDVSSYTSNSGDFTDSTGGLSEVIDGLSLCNGGVQSLPYVIAKKKSQAIEIINPATGKKVQL